jgi:hypothetical protein
LLNSVLTSCLEYFLISGYSQECRLIYALPALALPSANPPRSPGSFYKTNRIPSAGNWVVAIEVFLLPDSQLIEQGNVKPILNTLFTKIIGLLLTMPSGPMLGAEE